MKLFLSKTQRNHLLEILKASENNAINGRDFELSKAFSELYDKIKPENSEFVRLKREEAEIIVEFCEIVRQSLDNAHSFLLKDMVRAPEELEELKGRVVTARDEIQKVADQLEKKIRENPK